MIPQELKNSILQLAIQGKLVEQRPEEGTAEELYQHILSEKQRLIKAGTIKSDKPLPEITEDEKLFDIPDSWKWAYIGDLFQHNTGKALNSSNRDGTLMDYITTSNLYWNRFELDKLSQMLFTKSEAEKCTVVKGDLLVLEGGDVGRAAIWSYDFPMRIQNHIHRLRSYANVCVEFFYHVFFLYKFAGLINGKGIGIQGLSSSAIHKLMIPLPPLAEQRRIVAKIDELLPYIDRYEQAWSKLEELNKRFPTDMQKSILQIAIQGKLVEQRPEEGTGEELDQQIQAEKQRLIKEGKIKKEKPLPEIAEDEKPFDIPDSWKWVRLGDLANKLTDGTHSTPKYTENGVPFISVKDMSSGKLDFSYTKHISRAEHDMLYKRCNPEYGDLLISKVGTTGVPAIVNTEMPFSLFVSVALMKFSHNLLDVQYLYYMVFSPLVENQAKENTRGVGNKNWVLDKIRNTIVSLPPLAEQKRIVAKLEEILPLCEKL